MKTVTLKFVVKDSEADNINRAISEALDCGLEYTVYGWEINPSNNKEIEFKNEQDNIL